MNTKSLSSRQVHWAQELSCYYFRINYRQGKANGATDALSRYSQWNLGKEEILQAENMRILQCLQSLLINAHTSSTSFAHLASLKHINICRTHTFPDLCQSWETFHQELSTKDPYQATIGGMKLMLVELQAENSQARKIRAVKLGRNQKNSNGILNHESLPYIPEIIRTELISRHHDDPLAGHFGIEKTRELIARKYYQETFHHDVEVYIRDCDVCLVSKAVRHKPYGNLQQLPILTHCWKDLSIDFIIRLPQSANQRSNGYDLILVIVDWPTRIVYDEPVQTTITVSALAEVILNIVVRHYDLSDSIISNHDSVFTFKLWSSLCYFLRIKRRLSTTFHFLTDSQTQQQNSMIKAYFIAFVNYEQDNWTRFLPIVEFAYNNAKHASMGYTPFKLNCGYHLRVFYKEDINPYSKSKATDELTKKLRDLMAA